MSKPKDELEGIKGESQFERVIIFKLFTQMTWLDWTLFLGLLGFCFFAGKFVGGWKLKELQNQVDENSKQITTLKNDHSDLNSKLQNSTIQIRKQEKVIDSLNIIIDSHDKIYVGQSASSKFNTSIGKSGQTIINNTEPKK